MFTGIIEEIGKIKHKGLSSLTIEAHSILEDIHIGDSISVNGVCLTVTEYTDNLIVLDVMNETLKRTGLGLLNTGDKVNLERAISANRRFGGHFVSGHIDGTGKITDIKKDGIAVWVTVSADSKILNGIVMKGSVAIDGISLTVADVDRKSFKVSVIPHTQRITALLNKRKGDTVNIETDILGKYVEKLLNIKSDKKNLDMDFFIENGF